MNRKFIIQEYIEIIQKFLFVKHITKLPCNVYLYIIHFVIMVIMLIVLIKIKIVIVITTIVWPEHWEKYDWIDGADVLFNH